MSSFQKWLEDLEEKEPKTALALGIYLRFGKKTLFNEMVAIYEARSREIAALEREFDVLTNNFPNSSEGLRVRAAREAAQMTLKHETELAKIRLHELEEAAAEAERIANVQIQARQEEIAALNKFMVEN